MSILLDACIHRQLGDVEFGKLWRRSLRFLVDADNCEQLSGLEYGLLRWWPLGLLLDGIRSVLVDMRRPIEIAMRRLMNDIVRG